MRRNVRSQRALKLVKAWASEVGPGEAKRRLLNHKIGFSTVDQIVRGCYPCAPGERIVDVLLLEMAKDGFSLTGEEAS